MNIYKTFICKFNAVQLHFTSDYCLSGKGALAQMLSEDFRNPKMNLLWDALTNAHFYHEQIPSGIKDVYILRAANARVYDVAKDYTKTDPKLKHPYLYVIADLRGEDPVVMIEDYKEVPSSTREVVDVLINTANREINPRGWMLTMRRKEKGAMTMPDFLHPVLKPLMDEPRTIEEFHGVDNIGELYKRMKKRVDLRHAIDEKYKKKTDLILSILHEHVDVATTPKDIIKPLRAFFVAKIMRKPSWSEFKSECPYVVCSKSSFERLMSLTNDSYKDCQSFSELVETFLRLIKS